MPLGRLMILMASNGHFFTQMAHPMQRLSAMTLHLLSLQTWMHNFPCLLTGHCLLHSSPHFLGLHFFLSMIAIRELPISAPAEALPCLFFIMVSSSLFFSLQDLIALVERNYLLRRLSRKQTLHPLQEPPSQQRQLVVLGLRSGCQVDLLEQPRSCGEGAGRVTRREIELFLQLGRCEGGGGLGDLGDVQQKDFFEFH